MTSMRLETFTNSQIAVVIPCYKVERHILTVLASIRPEVKRIYVIDDCCPNESGKFVQENSKDPRVVVLRHSENQGVGGAVVTGYRQAIADGMDIAVKIDGDGQMDPALISRFVRPIVEGKADYTKGNRFFAFESLAQMPRVRLLGNAALSLINKLSSGYWSVMDPTNGYTAVHTKVLRLLPLQKLEKRYFFESDMLFRLNTVKAAVLDIPMTAKYGDEVSSMNLPLIILTFPRKFLVRFFKRIFYTYFLRDLNAGSIELVFGILLTLGGGIFGALHWYWSDQAGVATPTGTIMLATLPVLIGLQLLIAALIYDVYNTPRQPIHDLLD
jgi:glycosyltransferase involved in cell wall biosynthesis